MLRLHGDSQQKPRELSPDRSVGLLKRCAFFTSRHTTSTKGALCFYTPNRQLPPFYSWEQLLGPACSFTLDIFLSGPTFPPLLLLSLLIPRTPSPSLPLDILFPEASVSLPCP